MSDSKQLDLDALAPESRTIRFEGGDIVVPPPKTSAVMRIGALGQKMQDIGKLAPTEADALTQQLTDVIYECIPDLSGKALGTGQLLALIALLAEMAMPADAKELEARGITPTRPKAPDA